MTRQQARTITEAAIEELDKVADDHPKIAKSIGAVRLMLEDAVRLDSAIYDDDRAVKYLGSMLEQSAQVLRLPIRMRMAEGHADLIRSTQCSLEQAASQILGRIPPAPADPKTFERLTPAGVEIS